MKILEMIRNREIGTLDNASDVTDYTLLQLVTMMRSHGYSVLETCRGIKRINHVKDQMSLMNLKNFVESINVDYYMEKTIQISNLKTQQRNLRVQLTQIQKELDKLKLAAIKEAISLKEVRAILR